MSLATSRSPLIGICRRQGAAFRAVDDVMRLELHYRSDVDLSQPAMQVEIRNHIARCLRNHPDGDEGVITLAGVEHRFMGFSLIWQIWWLAILGFLAAAIVVLIAAWSIEREHEISADEVAQMERAG